MKIRETTIPTTGKKTILCQDITTPELKKTSETDERRFPPFQKENIMIFRTKVVLQQKRYYLQISLTNWEKEMKGRYTL